MKRASQGLSCLHKLLKPPGHSHLSAKTFSRLYQNGRKNTGPVTSVSINSNCCTSKNENNMTKYCFMTSRVRCIHDRRRVELASSAVFGQKTFKYSGTEFQTSHCITPLLTRTSAYSTSVSPNTVSPDVSKGHSALQVKRPVRKKAPLVSEEGKITQVDNVVAYAVAEDIDLPNLERYLLKQGLYSIGKLPQDVTNVLHVRGKYNVEQKPKEIFVFEDGSVIFWCVPETERGSFLKMLSKFSQGPYSSSLVLYEKEEIDFAYTSGHTSLVGDMIQLNDADRDSHPRLLEMYAFSNALAQSVKLAMWEASFNKFVSSFENVTEDLRQGRKISMSRQQVMMKTGELFSLRHLINLSSDLLDTPDFYWDREALEPLYVSLCNYLNVSRRTRVMNQKLNHCCELTELLTTQLNNAHHVRLEIMIIVLILVEVVFEIVHSVERYWNKQPTVTLDQSADGEVRKEPRTVLPH